ncbi:YceD family protein [Canibacter zhoujuaniae]|uniref:YceD family protein n=1 Tax=Canibacter zhoujuaniae TaxID=2708343 RepID=UPI001FBB7E0A|nr:YceD family protein [Canibacter zhoujuaniae]
MSTRKLFEFNIRDIYNRPGEMREFARTETLQEQWGEGLAKIPAGAAINADVRLESVHEGILATVSADAEAVAECGRCLTEFTETQEVAFTELFAYNPSEADEYGVHGDHVNLEPLLLNEFVLALPFQPVCRENCAGLDPETGERLTEPAAADAEKAVDPRWAALAEFSVANDQDK